ncbi:DUF4365 domain-containing protein [Micromonospora sp. NPDC049645]|uniref:DUF4365 domain-containing protein n=1 Tax=Micromonospora sp. NPDC049645 TaxID=3155508 RepID=UPI0034312D8D
MTGKFLRENRPIERAAVNAVTAFFEEMNCVVQSVDLVNDIGKDLYVDLVEDRRATGLVIAVQIKGGEQTSRHSSAGTTRGIPFTPNDADFFRSSTVPVVGVAHLQSDPTLHWVNLSDHCAERYANGDNRGGFAPAFGPLTRDTWPTFRAAMEEGVRGSSFAGALDLASDDALRQAAAVSDCFGLGRRDPRAMLLLRRLLGTLHSDGLHAAIAALAHTTPHPDILWTSANWVNGPVKDRLRREMVWTPEEISKLLTVVEDNGDMFGRGVFGEHIAMLLLQDPDLQQKAVTLVRTSTDWTVRYRALVYAIYKSDDDSEARNLMSDLLRSVPDLTNDRNVQLFAGEVSEHGWIDIF